MRRLKLVLNRPEYIRGWLAHTEDTALESVRDGILSIANKEDCAALLKILALVKSAKTAGLMLELMLSSNDSGGHRRWLDENVDLAIAGLIPVATGKGKLADVAFEYLRFPEAKGPRGLDPRLPGRRPAGRRREGPAQRPETTNGAISRVSTLKPRPSGCGLHATRRGSSSRPVGSSRTTCRRSSSMGQAE